jgi:outer membrane protein OmpA-like peptidoglycan-associated protein/tetratricopeptide (TPR) repeat protein
MHRKNPMISSKLPKANRLLLWAVLLGYAMPMAAQEACDNKPNAKAQKLFDQSNDRKKYEADKRFAFLEKSVEEDPECLPCLVRLGEMTFLQCKRTGASFKYASAHFLKVLELCPDYHPDTYYFLGAISYADREYTEAIGYFEKFLRFDDDGRKLTETKDYQKKYEEVEGALPSVRFYADFYANKFDFNPQVVSGASSEKDEYLPMISPDNELLFYTRKYQKQSKGDVKPRMVEEFTVSNRPDINARFSDGDALPSPFNKGIANYGGATISVNNKEMFVTVKNPSKENPDNYDIYRTKYRRVTDELTGKQLYVWEDLELMGPEINTPDGWESQPSLSADGNTLYFATVRPGCVPMKDGSPSTDIFYSERKSDGSWSQAKSLGEAINTSGNEKAPFMHTDSKTLYFASDGHRGAGGYDIFYTKMQPDGTWARPRNIGHPINTEEDEHGIVVSTDGVEAYFASNRLKGGKGGFDVFSFTLPENVRPERVMIVKGEVKTDEGEPAKNAVVEIKYNESKETQRFEVDEDDGKYAAVVNMEKNEDVVLSIKGEDIAFNTRVVARKDEERKPVITKLNMEAPIAAVNKPFIINDLYYQTNSSLIDNKSRQILDEFAAYLKENPSIHIEIRGHTDNVGKDQDNMALSLDRAFEVKGYLERNGIEGKRIVAKGFGKTKPLASNDTEAGRAQNRRTEFVITKR